MLLDLETIAKDSGISTWTWRYWIKLGRVPTVRLGRHIRIAEEDYREFVARHRSVKAFTAKASKVAKG